MVFDLRGWEYEKLVAVEEIMKIVSRHRAREATLGNEIYIKHNNIYLLLTRSLGVKVKNLMRAKKSSTSVVNLSKRSTNTAKTLKHFCV